MRKIVWLDNGVSVGKDTESACFWGGINPAADEAIRADNWRHTNANYHNWSDDALRYSIARLHNKR